MIQWQKNVIAELFVDFQSFLPSPHIKLGLVKRFIKELIKQSTEAYSYLKTTFQEPSEPKNLIITKVMVDSNFEEKFLN